MTGTHTCPQCGDAIAGDSPEGLCPRCLLQSGFAEGAASTPPSGVTTPHHGTFVPPPPAELAKHFPHLEILELLGQGGMGAVYKARQPNLDRLVAVKILPPEWGKDPAFAERFAREAKALARLTHPHIVAVHDFGERDGLFYLVMEYVDGANLRHILQEGQLNPSEALAIIPQICDALQYAHEEGVVHRDIKPENILLDSKGRVKIADFGLAKLLNRPRAAFTLTGSQQVMGTLDYMAPEQRLRPQEVDHRADIYSLGVVLYEMLTGELPLGRFEPPSQKVRVDARLDEVVFRALEREPARRYQKASQVKEDVQAITTGRHPRRDIPVVEAVAADHEVDRFQVAGPAAGLLLTGIIGILFWIVMGLIGIGMAQAPPPYANPNPFNSGPPVWPFLLMIVLGLPAGLFLIVASQRMARGRDYSLAMAGAIWAMFPWSPAFLLGLPCGIWALVVLRRPQVQTYFGVRRRPSAELAPPANGLLIAGILGSLFWTVLGLGLFLESKHWWSYQAFPGRDSERLAFLLMPLLGLPAGGLLVLGASHMLRRRSYHLALMAAMWACLPWSPAWIIALPFGIWALRVLGRRDVQLAFGLPFQQHEAAFERPMAAIPVARPAPQPPQPTGPIRRGVRSFFGSMYSLMFHSRMENPSSPAGSAPVLTALPADAALAAAQYVAHDPLQSWPEHRRSRRLIWPWIVIGILALLVSAVLFQVFVFGFRSKAVWLEAQRAASVRPSQGMTILEERYRDFITQRDLLYPFKQEVEAVFRKSEAEYLALEARFTKRERTGPSRVTITIKPFATELQELDKRLQSNLHAVIRRNMQQQGMKITSDGKTKAENPPQYVDQNAFPFGREEARIEIWRDFNGWYQGKVSRGKDKAVEEFSGPQLPKMYERFWAE